MSKLKHQLNENNSEQKYILTNSEHIRLNHIRQEFYNGNISFNEVLNIHQEWKNQHEYIVIAFLKQDARSYTNTQGKRLYFDFDYYAFKVSKRGNNVYQKRVQKRLLPLTQYIAKNKDKQFFEPESSEIKKTNILMITLTYGIKKCLQCRKHFALRLTRCPHCGSTAWLQVPIPQAWEHIGKDINTFIARLRQQYGNISIHRAIERYKNGYPHVHLIVHFHDHTFPVHRHTNKKGKQVWLIPNKDNQAIENYHHSYVQQEGLYSINGLSYITKYITKKTFQNDKNPTLVACWLYGKQQWSISKDFVPSLIDTLGDAEDKNRLGSFMHNSSKNIFENRKSWFVGLIVIQNPSDFIIFKLEPPPNDLNPEEKYEDHEEWLKVFSIKPYIEKEADNGKKESERDVVSSRLYREERLT